MGATVIGARPPLCPCSGLCPPVSSGGRVLQLPLVRAEDAGRYSCKASNEVGEAWLHYELAVLSEWLAWVGGWGGLGSAGPIRGPLKGVVVESVFSLAVLRG